MSQECQPLGKGLEDLFLPVLVWTSVWKPPMWLWQVMLAAKQGGSQCQCEAPALSFGLPLYSRYMQDGLGYRLGVLWQGDGTLVLCRRWCAAILL